MKKKVFKSKSLLLSLLLVTVVCFSLSGQEARKEYTESFDAGKGTTLSTDTRYSDIEVLTWDRDMVDILVVVEVDASSKSRAEDAIEKVHVEMGKSGNTITLDLDLENGWSKNVKTKIDATIKVPSYMNLTMDNAYGDVYIQEVDGLVLLDLKYSNLKADRLGRGNEKPYSALELGYGNASIGKAGWLELEIAYTDIEIADSDMLFMESKYSKLTGEKAGGIITEGAYDKYYLDEIDRFEAELKYSGIKFGILNKELVLDAGYTNTKIERLSGNFENVVASLSYGNIYLNTEDGAAYKLEGESKYGKISVDQEGKLSKSKEGTSMKVWGTVGSNPKASIKIQTRYGNAEIE
jgi:hypothetical protein